MIVLIQTLLKPSSPPINPKEAADHLFSTILSVKHAHFCHFLCQYIINFLFCVRANTKNRQSMTDCMISSHIRAHVLFCICSSIKGDEPVCDQAAVVCFLSVQLLKCETDIYSYFMVFDHYLKFNIWGLHSPDVHLLFGPNVLCSDSTHLSFVSGIRIKVCFCDVKLNTVPNRLLSLWCFLNLLLCLHLLIFSFLLLIGLF